MYENRMGNDYPRKRIDALRKLTIEIVVKMSKFEHEWEESLMRSLFELTREHRLERIVDEAFREVKLASLKSAEKEEAREILRRPSID